MFLFDNLVSSFPFMYSGKVKTTGPHLRSLVRRSLYTSWPGVCAKGSVHTVGAGPSYLFCTLTSRHLSMLQHSLDDLQASISVTSSFLCAKTFLCWKLPFCKSKEENPSAINNLACLLHSDIP